MTGPTGATGGGEGTVLQFVLDVTVAELLGASVTPLEVAPAPGADKYYMPVINTVFQGMPQTVFTQTVDDADAALAMFYNAPTDDVWAPISTNGQQSPDFGIFDPAQVDPRVDVGKTLSIYDGQMNETTSWLPIATVNNAPVKFGCFYEADGTPTPVGISSYASGASGPVVAAYFSAPNLSGNSGFVVGDTGYISQSGADDNATYIVTTVDPILGGVLSVTITAGGTNYTSDASDLSLVPAGGQPGVGSCDTAHIVCDGDNPICLRITFIAVVIDVLTI